MDLDKLLNWMCQEFRPTLIKPQEQGGVGWVKNDCIRTAKMAIALLLRFGIPAREVSAKLLIANKLLTAYLKKIGKELLYLTPLEVSQVAGAQVVMMGKRDGAPMIKGMWRGHLPVIVREEYLLDLTLDAANDLGEGFDLTPIAVRVGAEAASQIDAGKPFVIAGRGHHLLYQMDKDNDGYKQTSAWTFWSDTHHGITNAFEKRAREVIR